MSEVKKCPKCGGEMAKGKLRGSGGAYISFDKSGSFWLPQGEKVVAFRCQKCQYIELYREKKEDSTK
jgi:predicted nucleic-acid-binding Zn-ribbon protein